MTLGCIDPTVPQRRRLFFALLCELEPEEHD